MRTFNIQDTVGDVVARQPALARAFEQAGIDYCCGGRKTLDEVCRERNLDPSALLASLEEASSFTGQNQEVDVTAMSLTALADHIERTHHAYLRSELPRLNAMAAKVAAVHGSKDSRLHQIRETVLVLADELSSHMMKEEQILFPALRGLEASRTASTCPCGSLAGPIAQMEAEHAEAGGALERLRGLTDGYAPPDWACATYRTMLDALARLERDLHQHVHKENNVLFPRALDRQVCPRATDQPAD